MVCRGKEKRKRKRRKILGQGRRRRLQKEKEENISEREKLVGQMEERIGSIVYFKFKFSSNKCSLLCLVVDRMGELIVELMSVENVWCRWESWSFMHLSHRGMVGFGLRRNLGTTGKKHSSLPLPPQKVKKVLAMMTMISYERTSRT